MRHIVYNSAIRILMLSLLLGSARGYAALFVDEAICPMAGHHAEMVMEQVAACDETFTELSCVDCEQCSNCSMNALVHDDWQVVSRLENQPSPVCYLPCYPTPIEVDTPPPRLS